LAPLPRAVAGKEGKEEATMAETFDRNDVQPRIRTTAYRGRDATKLLTINVGIKGPSGDHAEIVGTLSVIAGGGQAISATFDAVGEGPPAKERLEAIASRLGGAGCHFNFYQVIVEDEPIDVAFGQEMRPPYVDPPRGGFLGSAEDWADSIPWYHDEMLPDDEPTSGNDHTAEGNVVNDGNSFTFYDDPHFINPPGESIKAKTMAFKTWLVLVYGPKGPGETDVTRAYRPVAFLGGFQWQVVQDTQGTATPSITRPTDHDYPSPAEYEDVLAKAYPAPSPAPPPTAPAWFDTDPRNFAPHSDDAS
jgi:hypothetical protein